MLNVIDIGGKAVEVPIDIKDYWLGRHRHDLYRLMPSLARGIFWDAKTAIDVGCYTSGLICEMDWIEKRVASDLNSNLVSNWAPVKDVEFVPGNAFELDFDERFDLVISNQTVEHVDNPAGFVEKLLDLGRGLIISTTYEVESGAIEGHIQDPISFEKFQSWFPCELDSWLICHHPTARSLKHIVGIVKQSHPNRI